MPLIKFTILIKKSLHFIKNGIFFKFEHQLTQPVSSLNLINNNGGYFKQNSVLSYCLTYFS